MKLSVKQKKVITRMREGYCLYENRITPGARWSLTMKGCSYSWGNVNGNVIDKIKHLMVASPIHWACWEYKLTELGKTIEL